MSSYSKQDHLVQKRILDRLELRRERWLQALAFTLRAYDSVLLVGDRPGPSAPKDIGYHHTPFYSTKHCSGWLNTLLELEGIPEQKLVWVNSANEKGKFYSYDLIESLQPDVIIALGGNAREWIRKGPNQGWIATFHPQYWKRFRSSERYELLDILHPLKNA